MSQEISVKAELLSQEVNIKQNIILEIEDIPIIFGAQPVFRVWEVGEPDNYRSIWFEDWWLNRNRKL